MVLLFALQGVASQIHYEPITLPEVVAASPTIVVVEDSDPPTKTVELDAGPVKMATNLMRLQVVEVIRAPEGQVSPEQIIEVGAANLEAQRSMLEAWHEVGLSISPIYQQYSGPEVTGRRVVFLQPCPVGLCLTVEGAVESVERLDEIRALIAARE